MSVRYSKKISPETVEHYDTKEEMEAASSAPASGLQLIRHIVSVIVTDFNPIFAIIGFFSGGALTFLAVHAAKSIDNIWRFIAIITCAFVCSCLFGKLGNAFLLFVVTLIGAGIILGGGFLVWKML